jgi:hypothetical protein
MEFEGAFEKDQGMEFLNLNWKTCYNLQVFIFFNDFKIIIILNQ